MSNRYSTGARPAASKVLFAALIGCVVLVTAGCDEPEDNEGTIVSGMPLPTDTLLNLSCADVGIGNETCVLTDPENPFANTVIIEFDVNNPEAFNKFELVNSIPAGPTGAKARFYFWATALARRQSGENQWYAARALHELCDATCNPSILDDYVNDPIRLHALRAYRSVLDNFFGSVTFFECCAGLNPVDPGSPVAFSVPLNELAADNLYRTASTPWVRLIPGDPLVAQALMAEWGYTYQPANPPDYNDGVLSINGG